MVSGIVGHQESMRIFRKAARTHSFLFVGPDSVGKFAAAVELAGEAAGCGGADRDRACPDRLVIEPRQETEKGITKERMIAVSDVRDALRELSLLPYAGTRRVLIVRDAHRLTEEAQNALLKTLEEPPAYATIILTTHAEGSLLPTIHSRCQRVEFHPVAEAVMRQAFSREAGVPEMLLGLGRPGLVRTFLDDPSKVREDLDRLSVLMRIGAISGKERLDLAETLAKDGTRLARVLDWWACRLESQGAARPENLFVAGRVLGLLDQVRRKPGNARLLLEELFVSL